MVKVTYIYLNTYLSKEGTEYYYIGSHTWKGPKWVVDPTYKGSSSVAHHFGWEPVEIKILATFEGNLKTLSVESKYIKEYCEEYGIADCALLIASNSHWISNYKPHGKMLNLHSNSMEQYYKAGIEAARAPEVRKIANKKSFETQKANGQFAKFLASSKTPEALEKSRQTRIANGSMSKWQQAIHSQEALAKKDFKDIAKKSQATKQSRLGRDNYQVKRLIDVFDSSNTLIISNSTVTNACSQLNNSGWSAWVNRCFMNGETEVLHHGYRFVLKSVINPTRSSKTKSDLIANYRPTQWREFFTSNKSINKQCKEKGYPYTTVIRYFSQDPSFVEWSKTFQPLSEADEKRFLDSLSWCKEANVEPLYTKLDWIGIIRTANGKQYNPYYSVRCLKCNTVYKTSFRTSVPHLSKCKCSLH